MVIMASGIARGLAVLLDDGGVAQDGCHTPNNRLTERHAALVYCKSKCKADRTAKVNFNTQYFG